MEIYRKLVTESSVSFKFNSFFTSLIYIVAS